MALAIASTSVASISFPIRKGVMNGLLFFEPRAMFFELTFRAESFAEAYNTKDVRFAHPFNCNEENAPKEEAHNSILMGLCKRMLWQGKSYHVPTTDSSPLRFEGNLRLLENNVLVIIYDRRNLT